MPTYTLIRYIGPQTDWLDIGYALKNPNGGLVVGEKGSPIMPKVFRRPEEAFDYVKHFGPLNSCVVWEGSMW